MNYLILVSEKYIYFRNRQKDVAKESPPHSKKNWIHVLRKCFSNYVYLKDIDKLERVNNSVHIKVDNFPKSVTF